MINKWNYKGMSDVMFSDQNQESYKKAAEFLGKEEPMEDWGCGTGWARYFFTNYKGIDGSLGYVKETTELTEYTSEVDNILLRAVIEHDENWLKILENAKKSFRKKLCLIIFPEFSDHTHVLEWYNNEVPTISFKKEEIMEVFKDCKTREENIISEHHPEWILYVEKN